MCPCGRPCAERGCGLGLASLYDSFLEGRKRAEANVRQRLLSHVRLLSESFSFNISDEWITMQRLAIGP